MQDPSPAGPAAAESPTPAAAAPPATGASAPAAVAVHTPDAPAPVGPYNQAVAAGGLLWCSGQIALDPRTGELVGGGDVEAETRQVLSNLQAVLAAAGVGPAQVVRTTVYLVDLADFARVNALYADVFGAGVAPARACVQVAALPKGVRVEIDAVAVLPPG
jgi:2-iminobutanoate/2-iminopropanoate deaminase